MVALFLGLPLSVCVFVGDLVGDLVPIILGNLDLDWCSGFRLGSKGLSAPCTSGGFSPLALVLDLVPICILQVHVQSPTSF